MAATAICLHLRRRRNTSILLFQNPISLHLFSSSSLIRDPPNNSDDQTPPSQSQTSLFSHSSDLKSSLKQQPESSQLPFYRKHVMARNGSLINTGSSTEGGKSPVKSGELTLGECMSHNIFVSCCEEEVRNGHRPNTTLGWANVQKEVATRIGIHYTIKQLENHWDSTRTDWQLYKELKRTYRGRNWRKFFKNDVSEAWWNERISENPEFEKIRGKERELVYYEASYDEFFGDIVATGEKARAPDQQSGIRRDSMCNEEFDPTPQEETRKEGSGDNDKDIATPILSPTSYSGKSKVSKRKMSEKDELVQWAELVREGLDGILRALSTATTAANEGGSYAKALDMLDSMDGVEPMSSLYHFGQQFLGKIENRVLWFKSRNDEYRLSALKYNYEEHLRNGGC